MASSIKRSLFGVYMNTTPSATASYNIIGSGVTSLEVAYNPQKKTEQYINADTASTILTGYQPTAPITSTAMKTDAVFEFVNDVRQARKIGSAAETDVILVDIFDAADPLVLTAVPAQKQPVIISIDSFGGAGSDPLSISYTLDFKGDATTGVFNCTTKAFTAS